jgi:hypothetical protein
LAWYPLKKVVAQELNNSVLRSRQLEDNGLHKLFELIVIVNFVHLDYGEHVAAVLLRIQQEKLIHRGQRLEAEAVEQSVI